MRLCLRSLASFAFLAAAVAPSTALAQKSPGFAVNEFNPSEKGSDWFANESLDLRGKLRPALGVILETSSDPLSFRYPDDSRLGSVISSQVYAHVGGSLVMFDRLRLGVSLPVALYQNGEATKLAYTTGETLQPPSKAAVGDLRVGADLRILGEYKDAFTAAIGVQAHLPTGVQEQYTGDGKARVAPRLMIAGDLFDTIAYAARIGYEFRGHTDSYAGVPIGNEITGAFAVGFRALDRHLLIGPELYANTLASDAFKSATSPGDVILGAHYGWDDWKIGLGFGTGLTTGLGSPNARAILGLEWSPAIPEPKPADRDGDGVDDAHDACPDQAGVKTEDPKTNGCPAPVVVTPTDKDGDGINDVDDACPDVAGVKSDDPKKNGCPPPPPDKDGDGILDADDACPDVAGVKNEDPKKNGCPAPTDKDGDGVMDDVDACPDKAGPASEDPKKNGCPALAVISQGQIKIMEQVKFKTGSAQILGESDALLTEVKGILTDHPEIKKVRVEGHTDNRGAAAMNRTLSQKRAASVVGWLTLKGIDKSRLSSQGFGPDKPIDSNETDAGRANNRRVEFHIEP